MELEFRGWRWERWVPASQRRKHASVFPSGYKHGGEKLWFSGAKPSTAYMQLLLVCEDAWGRLHHKILVVAEDKINICMGHC
eukprot:4893405-Prorocentrum_lima.AAC.1